MALFDVVILRVTGELPVSIEAANEAGALQAALESAGRSVNVLPYAAPAYRRVALLASTLAASTAGATLAESTNETKAIRPPA